MKEKATIEKVYPRKRNAAIPTLCKFLTDQKQIQIQISSTNVFSEISKRPTRSRK